ncbi:GH39 family glycosyl hydrolase [Kribbella sp. NPDC002412]
MRRWKALLLPLALILAGLPAVTAEGATSATVEVKATYGADIGTLDKDLVLRASQGGYLTLQNLHVLADHADELHDLGLREIRVDHVFDDEFYDVVKGVDSFDFTKLDGVLQPLVNNGIRPWISLSYMPRELGPTIFSPPTDYAAWGRAVEAMVRHYASRGGAYRGWNWEVWNEPDHNAGFWAGTTAQYNSLYGVSAAAVKRGDPTAQVGGPGVATPTTPLFGPWMDYIAANPTVPCDFVSWHSYGPNEFDSTAQIRTELSRRGIPAKKLYITEWNSTFRMDNGPGTWPDTHQTASYALERMYNALDEDGLSGVHFFSGLEGWHPTLDFNGDLGLLTVEGRRKAVANAFDMVNRMGDTRLDTDVTGNSGTATYGLVTSNPSARKVSVLLWNNTLNTTEFRPTVDNLPFGTSPFGVTRYDVNASNSYSDVAAGLASQRPSPHEGLTPSSRTVVPGASTWSSSVTLAPNAVALIELSPSTDTTIPAVETTVNLARKAVVTASSSYPDPTRGWSREALVDGRQYSYAGANEGDPTMGWTSVEHSSANAAESVQVDLGSKRAFDAVTLWPRSDQAGDGSSFPADFTVSGSDDGVNWSAPLVSRTGYGNGSAVKGPQTFAVSASYRYLKVSATKLGLPVAEAGGPAYRFQLAELEVTKKAVNVLVANPGFQSGQLSGWTATGNGTVAATGGRSGAAVATFTGAGNGVLTTVTGLTPNTRYTFSGYLKSADPVYLGVKNYGGPETSSPVSTAPYSPTSVTFTTGAGSTTATLYAYKNSGTAKAWFDDFALVAGG